jgi:hypothetical protein
VTRSTWKRPGATIAVLALAGLLFTSVACDRRPDDETGQPAPAPAQAAARTVTVAATALAADDNWGTITGQVVWQGKAPPNPEVNITNDKDHCASKGPILRNDLIVNKKNNGVRWTLVWLAPVKDFKDPDKVPPIHPSLAKVPAKVEIDQPVCIFVPRMTAMREGSELVFKNSAPVPHNVSVNGAPLGPTDNKLLPAKTGILAFKDVKARFMPFSYSCSIHPWMKGWIGVFKHPYTAVTDEDGKFEIKNAPVGNWRLILWHEKVGWVVFKNTNDIGKVIAVKPKGKTDAGKIEMKETDD